MKKGLLSTDDLNLLWLICMPVLFICAVKLMVNSPHSICIFKLITGKECWGCGLTRAFNALFDLHFHRAFEYNPRIVIVAPLMLIAWAQTLITAIKNRKKHTFVMLSIDEVKKEVNDGKK